MGKSERINSMSSYVRDLQELPLIDVAEEARLAALIQEGDQDAWAELIQSNLRLVIKIAHDFSWGAVSLQELVSEGNIGLMHAAKKFDPKKGAKFSSYASWWIKQGMRKKLLTSHQAMRVPATASGNIKKIRKARSNLLTSLRREPTNAEIAQKVDLSERVVKNLRHADVRIVYMNEQLGPDSDDGSFSNFIPDKNTASPDAIIEMAEIQDKIAALLNGLDPREKKILIARYGLNGAPPKTLEEVSQLIGRTRERVRQIQKKALAKLLPKMKEAGVDSSSLSLFTKD